MRFKIIWFRLVLPIFAKENRLYLLILNLMILKSQDANPSSRHHLNLAIFSLWLREFCINSTLFAWFKSIFIISFRLLYLSNFLGLTKTIKLQKKLPLSFSLNLMLLKYCLALYRQSWTSFNLKILLAWLNNEIVTCLLALYCVPKKNLSSLSAVYELHFLSVPYQVFDSFFAL